jgi:hypothetical protein
VQHIFSLRNLAVGLGLAENLGDVVSDGFRQTGGMHGDDVRVVYGEDIVDRLQKVGLAAKNGGPFGKGTGGRQDRFFVVPGQRGAMIGIAALGAVAVRKAAVNAQRGIHGPDGLAGLGRIDGQRLALGYFFGCMSQ